MYHRRKLWQNPVPLRSNRAALSSVFVKAAWFEEVKTNRDPAVVEYTYDKTVDHAEYSMVHVLRRLFDMKPSQATERYELPLETKLELEQQIEDLRSAPPATREATAAEVTAVGGMEPTQVQGGLSRSGRSTTRPARLS